MFLYVIAFVVATMAASPASSAVQSDDQNVFTGAVPQGSWIRVRNLRGNIEVLEATGRDVVVTARKAYDSDNYSDVTFRVVRDGSSVTICAVWPGTRSCDAEGYDYSSDYREYGRRRAGRVDFTVMLPRGVKVLAGTGNGRVMVRNAGAEVNASSGNGEVRVLGANGGVRASSGNGEIEVDNARGEVKASSGNGDITVRTSIGPVSASSGNGRIDVRMASLPQPSDMSFSTGNGDITIGFPANLSATIDAGVPLRNLTTDFPMEMASRWSASHVEAKIGGGGPRIRFSTGNGRVWIQKNS